MRHAVFAVFVGAAVVAAALAKTDRDRAELTGPVHTVESVWQSNQADAAGQAGRTRLGIVTYDRAGNLLTDRSYTPDYTKDRTPERHGQAVTIFRSVMGTSVEHYRFDAAGNLIERTEWLADTANGPAAMTERMTYDTAGRVKTREFLDPNGISFDVREYWRDDRGNITLEEDRPSDGRAPFPRMHYTYTFDAHGNWTTRVVRRENVPEDAREYRYAGNILRTLTYY